MTEILLLSLYGTHTFDMYTTSGGIYVSQVQCWYDRGDWTSYNTAILSFKTTVDQHGFLLGAYQIGGP